LWREVRSQLDHDWVVIDASEFDHGPESHDGSQSLENGAEPQAEGMGRTKVGR
jgi:hypothetical protein